MAPTQVKKQSWSEINKHHKEERKKWKQKSLEKKLKKQAETKKSVEQVSETDDVHELPTISIAVPGSIMENAQSAELRTYLAGQIARAACIFKIDEVIVFDDFADEANAKRDTLQDLSGLKSVRECCAQLGRILQYLECPQYLRKHFFPIHKDLKFAGLLNPLDAPHHLRQNNTFAFRCVCI